MFNKKQCCDSLLVKRAVVCGLGEAIYIVLVAWFFSVASVLFGNSNDNQVGTMIIMLSLLVFSVALSGLLVFGQAAFYFFQKKYQEALASAGLTVATIGVVLVLFVLAQVLIR